MNAVLVSNFPVNFTEQVAGKLGDHGVAVVATCTTAQPAQSAIAGADVLLVLHELMSHSDDRRMKRLARSYGKPVLYLPRKAARWDERLRFALETFGRSGPTGDAPVLENIKEDNPAQVVDQDAEEEAMKKKVVQGRLIEAENIQGFLEAFTSMREQGMDYRQIVADGRLNAYLARPLKNATHLQTFTQWLSRRRDAPGWFVQWRQDHRSPSGRRPKGKKVAAQPPSSDWEQLAAEYAKERDALRAEVERLKKTARADGEGVSCERLRIIASSLRQLIHARLIGPEQAFEMIEKLAG